MKKFNTVLLGLLCVLSFSACDKTTPNNPTTDTPTATESTQPSASTNTNKENDDQQEKKVEAGLGDLKIRYNTSWKYDESQTENQGLAFIKGDALIGIACSQENTYQHPLSMMTSALNMVTSAEGFKFIEEPTKITVNNQTWYECIYEKDNNGKVEKSLQRCYGKNYYAYTVTYTALGDDYDKYEKEATEILNSVIMDVPDNIAGQAAAMKKLVGKYDAGENGYLELNDDNTYYWYMDDSKDMNNVHYGTYECDNQILSMQVETDKGYYLILYPEHFIVEGKESDMGTPKLEFGIADDPADSSSLQAVNMGNYNIYNLKKLNK